MIINNLILTGKPEAWILNPCFFLFFIKSRGGITMGILLDTVKFLKKQKSSTHTTPDYIDHVEELFTEDHGPPIEAHINSEFWHISHPKLSSRKE
jgi:hypothetical protein